MSGRERHPQTDQGNVAASLQAVSKLVGKWIDLFRAGDYSAAGKGVFTARDVQQIAEAYDPQRHEAPAVIGHAEGSAPAWGWFDKLRAVGDTLQGSMRQIDPAFEELVESGKFKKRSVELYRGNDGWSLRRVAFLGAQPPQVKGLADIQFEQEDKEAVEIEFSEETAMAEVNETVVENALTKFFAKFTKKDPEAKTFSEDELKRIAKEAADAAVKAAVEPLQAKFAETEKHASTAASKARAEQAVSKLKADSRWVPAFEKMGLGLVFEELAKTEETVEFGEGADKKKITPLEALVAFMEALPKIVPAGQVYHGQKTSGGQGTTNFNETPRTPADPNSVQLDAATRKRMGEKNISYGEAMMQVVAENPELAKPGGAAAGQV